MTSLAMKLVGAILILGLVATFGYRVGYKHGHDAAEALYTDQIRADAAAAELQLKTQTIEDAQALKDAQDRAAFSEQLVKDSIANNAALSKQLASAEQSLKLIKVSPDEKCLDTPYSDSVRQLHDPLVPDNQAGDRGAPGAGKAGSQPQGQGEPPN